MSLVIEPIISFCNAFSILLGAFNKVPQIRTLWQQQTVSGVSVMSVLIELTGYCITMSYFIAKGYAIQSFLEYPFLVLQDACIISIVLWLGGESVVLIAGFAGLQLSLIYGMIGGLFNDTLMALLVTSTTPISAFSKVVQLTSILRSKCSEGVSVTSWLISASTCLTRIITIYVESADVALLTNFTISIILNMAIVVSALYYASSGNQTAKHKKKN